VTFSTLHFILKVYIKLNINIIFGLKC